MGADTPLVKKKDERNLMQMTIKDRGYRLGRRPGKQGPLRFADDIDLLEHNHEKLQENVHELNIAAQRAGIKINVNKTKAMVIGEETTDMEIKVQDEVIEDVKEFVYLGILLTWNNDCTKEIKRRTAKAKGVMAGLNTIWNSKQISYKTKLNVLKT